MTLDDWRWNAEQFNHIGERVHAAGMRFAYHNHTPEFRSEKGVVFYDELIRSTDPVESHHGIGLRLGNGCRQESRGLADALSYPLFPCCT